ncbi:MAG: homoserine dehydrogenase [Lachnospiraceae bacterium]|nr:homoserine dehydrogenase [Lachnospiraceae bacterium]
MAKIAILGYGTVGSGVYEVIKTNQAIVNANAGEDIDIKYVLDLRDFPGDPVEKILVHDYDVILNDDEVSVVVEVMGGVEPAYTFVKNALLKGKSVCTSNKALVAAKGPELIRIAKEKNINFFFEASVGGGIPIIRPMKECLTADDILEVSGILNGTTNYMLTKMADEGWEFDKALKTAQDLGYAERDPSADIEGYDACRKIAILTSLYSGKNTDFEKIYTEGITGITATDIKYASAMKMVIKLVAISMKEKDDKGNEGIVSMVCPVMLDRVHPLYGVNDVINAVFVKGNVLGPVMFYGSGAGKLPTASAVVSDVVEAVKTCKNEYIGWDAEELKLMSVGSVRRSFFVRMKGSEKDKLAEAESIFGPVTVVKAPGVDGEFGFVTGEMSEDDFNGKYEKLDGAITRIRVNQR